MKYEKLALNLMISKKFEDLIPKQKLLRKLKGLRIGGIVLVLPCSMNSPAYLISGHWTDQKTMLIP